MILAAVKKLDRAKCNTPGFIINGEFVRVQSRRGRGRGRCHEEPPEAATRGTHGEARD